MRRTFGIFVCGAIFLTLAGGEMVFQRAATDEAAASLSLEVDQRAVAAYDFTALRKLLQDAVDSGKAPSASMLLIHRDKVIYKEAFGWADIENKKPLRTDTVCHLASSTKWITAAAIMAAVEEGRISLDDPVGKYLPALKDIPVKGSSQKGNPTIRQCWSHTSGFPPALEFQVLIKPGVRLLDSVEAYSKGQPELGAAPGTEFEYGNTGMTVTGAIMEKLTGKPFRDFVQERILDPLGMKDTGFNPQGDQLRRASNRYAPREGGGFQLMPNGKPTGDVRVTIVGGGLYSTLDDYAKFLTMILHGGRLGSRRALSEKSVREICKDQTGGAPIKQSPYRNQKGYGIGVAVMEVDSKGSPILVTDGGLFGTYCWIDFKRELIGVFFTQTMLRNVYELAVFEEVAAARTAFDGAASKQHSKAPK